MVNGTLGRSVESAHRYRNRHGGGAVRLTGRVVPRAPVSSRNLLSGSLLPSTVCLSALHSLDERTNDHREILT